MNGMGRDAHGNRQILSLARQWLFVGGWVLAGCQVGDRAVVAKVDEEIIRAGDVKAAALRMSGPARVRLAQPAARRALLVSLIDSRVRVILARRRGLESDPSYQALLKVQDQYPAERRRTIQESYLCQLLDDKMTSELPKPTEQEIQQYYNSNHAAYARQNVLSVFKILCADPAQARAAADFMARGGSFAEAAKRFSIDRETTDQAGRMETVLSAELRPETRQTILNLPVGHTSGVIETSAGYEIYHKAGERPAEYLDLKPFMTNVVRVRSARHWFDQAKQKMQIQIDEKSFNRIRFN